MILKELIERELEQYLEWPTADRSHVTTVSAKLFAEHVARLYADHFRGAGNIAAPAVQGEPVGWQFYQHGEWRNGDDTIKGHRKNTEEAGFRVRDVYACPAEQEPAPDVDVLVEALEGFLAIVAESSGVAGYYLYGDIAEWDEFKEVTLAEEALSAHRKGGEQ